MTNRRWLCDRIRNMTNRRWLCDRCGEVTNEADLLEAPNPFYPGENLTGCPACRSAESVQRACDTRDCPAPASSGTPTTTGYVYACFKHQPQKTRL